MVERLVGPVRHACCSTGCWWSRDMTSLVQVGAMRRCTLEPRLIDGLNHTRSPVRMLQINDRDTNVVRGFTYEPSKQSASNSSTAATSANQSPYQSVCLRFATTWHNRKRRHSRHPNCHEDPTAREVVFHLVEIRDRKQIAELPGADGWLLVVRYIQTQLEFYQSAKINGVKSNSTPIAPCLYCFRC
jgi:hypothetical protein